MSASSKILQGVVTFAVGGSIVFFAWPRLDILSKSVIALFGCLAAVSIHNGTWLADSRELRREARDHRQQAYKQVKTYMNGKYQKQY